MGVGFIGLGVMGQMVARTDTLRVTGSPAT